MQHLSPVVTGYLNLRKLKYTQIQWVPAFPDLTSHQAHTNKQPLQPARLPSWQILDASAASTLGSLPCLVLAAPHH